MTDFPLQTGKLVAWKKRHLAGLIVHSGIFYPVAVILLIPLLSSTWPFILILGLLHFMVDWTKVSFITRSTEDTLWPFLLDQALHIGSTLIVSYLAAYFLRIESSQIGKIYNLNLLIFISGFILAAFVTPILFYYLKSTFINGQDKKIEIDVYGFLERSLVFLLVVLPGQFYLFFIIILFLRWRILTRKGEITAFNLLTSPLIAAITGLIIRILV